MCLQLNNANDTESSKIDATGAFYYDPIATTIYNRQKEVDIFRHSLHCSLLIRILVGSIVFKLLW